MPLVSGLPRRNGQTIAERTGTRTPDRTQRLLSRASWDTLPAMGEVRRFAVAGLEEAARRSGCAAAWWPERWMRPVRSNRARPPPGPGGTTWAALEGGERDHNGAPDVCAEAAVRLLAGTGWQVRPAGKAPRAAWLGTISPRHWLLIRRLLAALLLRPWPPGHAAH